MASKGVASKGAGTGPVEPRVGPAVGPPRPGRPRAEGADEAILVATLQLLAERGYKGMSIPAVAAAAGVTKPTVYLRYGSKFEVALAAIASLGELTRLPDTGSARRDLVSLLDGGRRGLDRLGASLLGVVLAEEPEHPEFLDRMRAQVVGPHGELYRQVIRRGIASGEIRPDADVDAVVDLLQGAYLGRYLAAHPRRSRWAERVVASVWPGLEADRGVRPEVGCRDGAVACSG